MKTTHWPFTLPKLEARLRLITPFVHRRSSPLARFRLRELDGATVDIRTDGAPEIWQEIAPQSYWGRADLNFVMCSGFKVPDGWHADRIALSLPLGVLGDIFNHPEALVEVDGNAIGSADRYHHTIALDPELADGRAHQLSLHGWTGLTGWPPKPQCKAKLFMGDPQLVERDPDALAFCRTAAAALDSLHQLDPESRIYAALLDAVDHAFAHLDTRAPIGAAFYASCPAALALL